MSILSSNKPLSIARILQFLVCIAFLVLIGYSGVHRGWWRGINGALAVGVIATILTLILTLISLLLPLFRRSLANPFKNPSSTLKLIALVITEIIVMLIWVATVTLMLRPKAGCDKYKGQKGEWFGKQACFPKGDAGHDTVHFYVDEVPKGKWDVGTGLAIAEVVMFFVTAVWVFLDERGRKGSGAGTSYA